MDPTTSAGQATDSEPAAEPEPEPAEQMTVDEAMAVAIAEERNRRLWVRSLTSVVALRRHDGTAESVAFRLMIEACCDRICRICRSDLDV